MKSGNYAYRDRRQKKRDFRKLWITRISAAARQNDISYSKLMHGLKVANIDINRKMLSELAISDEEAFTQLVDHAKAAINYLCYIRLYSNISFNLFILVLYSYN